ncbi:hypothetical protein [Robbsia andropogonis]|uniref:hypothetical protein n=1 Tax=Robbsia andropogonis TaxID=28092 RepID=UPI000A761C0D|nr:hypothetical protein [Robbsia andropogonis]
MQSFAPLACPNLVCYNVQSFPHVTVDWPHLSSVDPQRWHDDTAALLDMDTPFVLFVTDMPGDRKTRLGGPLKWYKVFHEAFGACCRAVIVIEADPSRRVMMRIDTPQLEKAFGTDVHMAPDREQAERLSQRLLNTPPIPLSAR